MERLENLIEKCGLSREQIVQEWARKGLIDLSLIRSEAPRVVYVNVNSIKPGMYLYNNAVSPEYTKGALGVVYDVSETEIFALAINGKLLPFSHNGFSAEDAGIFAGLSSTCFIIELADSVGKSVEAAAYCFAYSNNVVQPNTAFLLADRDIEKLQANSAAVYEAFKKTGLADARIWTCGTVPVEQTAKAGYYSFASAQLMPESVTVSLPVHPAFIVKKSQIKNRISS